MNRNRIITVATALVVVGLASTVSAADTRGVLLGLDLHTNTIGPTDRDPNAPPGTVYVDGITGGVSLLVGYGFTESFALRLNLSGARHETTDADIDVVFASVTLEGTYYFNQPQPLRPYVLGGIGGFSSRSEQDRLDFETTGPGVVTGGGMSYFVGQNVALDFGVRLDLVNWKERRAIATAENGTQTIVETPIEDDGGAVKFLFGVNFWL